MKKTNNNSGKSNNAANNNNNNNSKAAKKSKEDVYLVLSVAVTGRSPVNGSILSLGAVAVAFSATAGRRILGTFQANLLPLPGAERLSTVDVAGFWKTRRRELEVISENRQPADRVFASFTTFCKAYPNLTLVGSPLLSVYGWISYYWTVLCPGAAMPWGFSGLCARSYASGLLGVSMKDLSKSPAYKLLCDGLEPTGIPVEDALCGAALISNAMLVSAAPRGPGSSYDTLLQRSSAAPQPQDTAADNASTDNAAAAPLFPLQWECPPVAPFPAAPSFVTASLPFRVFPSIFSPEFERDALAQIDALFGDGHPHRDSDSEWVATEKVHGSNFTILTDGQGGIRGAKRTALLEDGSSFFQYEYIIERLRQSIDRVYQAVVRSVSTDLEAEGKRVAVVAIAGEMAGGEYLHPGVALDLRGTRVQNGVQYAPDNFFYAFDISYLVVPVAQKDSTLASQAETKGQWIYLDFDRFQSVCHDSGLLSSLVIQRGSLAELMQIDLDFDTKVPSQLLHLPSIPQNTAEGIVLRPVLEKSLPDGRRVLVKRKHPKFSEFAHLAAAATPLEMLRKLATNVNRVDAVMSKLTLAERAQGSETAKLVVLDAMVDVAKLYPEFSPSPQEQEELAKEVLMLFAQ